MNERGRRGFAALDARWVAAGALLLLLPSAGSAAGASPEDKGFDMGSSPAATHRLTCGDFVVDVMDPAAPDRYNRGVRFTPVAAILSASRGTNEFLFHEAEHDPLTGAAGLLAEFDPVGPPPGFAEADIGEGYVKIGVGVLEKDAASYGFWPQHAVVRPAQTTVTWGESNAQFHQTCPLYGGYGYELAARVEVGAGTITVDWRLKNIGSKVLDTRQYAHNSFRFNRRPVGLGYEARFPCDIQVRGLQDEQRQSGRSILFTAPIPLAANIEVDYPVGCTGPDVIEVRHVDGLSARCTTSIPSVRTVLHASADYLCPEQFVAIRLDPGEEVAWRRGYEFGIAESRIQKSCPVSSFDETNSEF